jgi:flagellar basal-body rod protein FlgB
MNINGMNALSSDGGEKDEKFWNNAVRLVEQRLGLIASNIANADTPNYKARDIDFSSALKQAMTNSKLPVLSEGEFTISCLIEASCRAKTLLDTGHESFQLVKSASFVMHQPSKLQL